MYGCFSFNTKILNNTLSSKLFRLLITALLYLKQLKNFSNFVLQHQTMKNLYLILFLLANILGVYSQESFSVYFESNKYKLTSAEEQKLNKWVSENKDSKIVAVNGYTDEDGTNGFNDTLAKKRVDFIVNLLKDKIKIREDFKTRSYGENHQLSKIKSENRKVSVYFITSKDLSREDEILGITKPEPIKKIKPAISYPPKLVFDNPNGTKTEMKLDTIFMQKINHAKVGEKITLENLNFQINTFAIVPESRAKLFELLMVMRSNPGLKIQIQGHICCMPSDKQDLSTKRAKAIYSFLVAYEINKANLSYKGFGTTVPIYPIPEKNEGERAANRRVEIEIMENE